MSNTVEWFFGRGLSIGCGLCWSVPTKWRTLNRDDQIAQIKTAVLSAMAAIDLDVTDISDFLNLIAQRTVHPWQHRFYTTNWDYLLQREILNLGLKVKPQWCAGAHVHHLNGTVEETPDSSRRSEFVLETDTAQHRVTKNEGEIAFNKFIWSKTFVIVGMSFECEVDRYLFSALNRVEDNLPIGESSWIVVNPSKDVLEATRAHLREALPRAIIHCSAKTFRAWLHSGVPELQSRGAVTF